VPGTLPGITLESASRHGHANSSQTHWPTILLIKIFSIWHLQDNNHFHSVTITNCPLISVAFPFTLSPQHSSAFPHSFPQSLSPLPVCRRPPVGMCEMRISRRTLLVLLSSKKNPDRRKQGENRSLPSVSLNLSVY